MSATQSKAKIRSGKARKYYGRQRGGYRSCGGSEITLQHLQSFSAADFEACSARGEEFRQRLYDAVLNALSLSKVWLTDCECLDEWGGGFPVHLRLTHRKNRHVTLDILSPGSESPFWHGLLWVNPDHTGLYVLNTEQFEPETIGRLLTRIEEMVSAGITPAEIVAVLGRKGGCV